MDCMRAPVGRRPGAAEEAVDQLSVSRGGRSSQTALMDDVCNRGPAKVRLSHVSVEGPVGPGLLGSAGEGELGSPQLPQMEGTRNRGGGGCLESYSCGVRHLQHRSRSAPNATRRLTARRVSALERLPSSSSLSCPALQPHGLPPTANQFPLVIIPIPSSTAPVFAADCSPDAPRVEDGHPRHRSAGSSAEPF